MGINTKNEKALKKAYNTLKKIFRAMYLEYGFANRKIFQKYVMLLILTPRTSDRFLQSNLSGYYRIQIVL